MPEKSRVLNVIAFLLSAILAPAGLAACGDRIPTPGADSTPTMAGSRGQIVYAKYCNVCHPGGGRGSGPSLMNLSMPTDEMENLVRHGKAQMPGFGPAIIDEDDLNALVEYVQGLGK